MPAFIYGSHNVHCSGMFTICPCHVYAWFTRIHYPRPPFGFELHTNALVWRMCKHEQVSILLPSQQRSQSWSIIRRTWSQPNWCLPAVTAYIYRTIVHVFVLRNYSNFPHVKPRSCIVSVSFRSHQNNIFLHNKSQSKSLSKKVVGVF